MRPKTWKDAGWAWEKAVARKWNEANCRSPGRVWFLQRLASPARFPRRGNQKPLIHRGLNENRTGTDGSGIAGKHWP
ncbi:MAG: hypothetical protein WA654_09710, partial [Candidatus Sulfotelmatobacter sp.]